MTQPQAAAEQVRDAVLAVPGVADLHAGMLGEVGTYLPGRRVAGVRLTQNSTRDSQNVAEVHVTVHRGMPVRETAGLVRRAVAILVGTDTRIDVVVEDVAT